MKSGNFNFVEPSEPLQACNRTALPFYSTESRTLISILFIMTLVMTYNCRQLTVCNVNWKYSTWVEMSKSSCLLYGNKTWCSSQKHFGKKISSFDGHLQLIILKNGSNSLVLQGDHMCSFILVTLYWLTWLQSFSTPQSQKLQSTQ